MLDIKWVLENQDHAKKAFEQRGSAVSVDELIRVNDERKELQLQFDELRAEQKSKSKLIGQYKKEGKDAQPILDEVNQIADKVKELNHKQSEAENTLKSLLHQIPNIPHESVPVGSDESANVVARSWGQKREFAFKAKEHWELGEDLGLLDFERAAKLAGSRFAIYRGALAKLERALIQFMLRVQTEENGYEELMTPYLVNADTLTGTGQLPKFEEDLFKTTSGYYLIPTAEVPVTNFYRDEVVNEKELPYSFCAYTPCFRSEAGSYGKDIKGLIRQHQFNKVELVKITKQEESYAALEKLTNDAESILQKLNLPYRVMTLCTGDMGFGAAKTYDIEVWLPGQNQYREISSCSNCEAFQGRRMNTRYKDSNGKMQFVHTLNGSGLAVGRTLIAVLENYQQEDGSILVPEALQHSMGCEVIKKP
ncbi:MAG: serine--tRNA ligase [Deltaproteobacteria bacterium]|nr:serine--tRNA ligase [Deltaproteobacteria bacterium]